MAPNSLKILSANIRGFKANVGELTHAVLRNKADIVVAVETFLNNTCVDRIPGYSHWARRNRTGGQGWGVTVCYREGLQLQQLFVPAPEEMEAMFFRLLLTDKTAVLLLCVLYRLPWQGGAPLTFLIGQLDAIMATHDCQSTTIVGGLRQHIVHRDFTELTVVHGFTNHVNFPTHIHGASGEPVLTDLPNDSVQCYQLNRIGTSYHDAIF